MTELEKLRKERDELDKKIKEMEKNKPWQPKYAERFFHIRATGYIDETKNLNDRSDVNMAIFGNCFKTKEEAMRYRDFIWILNNLYHDADVKHPKQDEDVFYPAVFRESKTAPPVFKPFSKRCFSLLPFGFSSREKLEQAIGDIGRDEFVRVWRGE